MAENTSCECGKGTMVPVTGLKIGLDLSGIVSGGTGEAGINYSTEEQFTGQLWLDGKKIYQKTIVYPKGVAARSQAKFPHEINNLYQVIALHGMAVDGNTTITVPHVGYNNLGVWHAAGQIVLQSGADPRTGPFYVTVVYTCTDR